MSDHYAQSMTHTPARISRLRTAIVWLLLASSMPSFADTPPSKIDARIYGGESLTPRPELEATPAYVPPTPVPATDALKGLTSATKGAENLQTDRRDSATMVDSAGAALSRSLPGRAFEHAPQFDWEKGYSPLPLLRQVDFALDSEQERFLLETRSAAEFQYRLAKLREQNRAREAMADHPITALITTAFGYVLFVFAPIIGLWRFFRRRKKLTNNPSNSL